MLIQSSRQDGYFTRSPGSATLRVFRRAGLRPRIRGSPVETSAATNLQIFLSWRHPISPSTKLQPDFFRSVDQFNPTACGGFLSVDIPQQITMSVDADLITFVKNTIWLGGGFVAIYALIGVAFFGWDVRKARGSIIDAQNNCRSVFLLKLGNLGEWGRPFAADRKDAPRETAGGRWIVLIA